MVVTQPPLPLDVVPAPDWRLNEHTRDVGRRGLAEARAALAAARRRAQRRETERHQAA
jgi:hypothetical protein